MMGMIEAVDDARDVPAVAAGGEIDLYVWEGSADIALRAERALEGHDVSVLRVDLADDDLAMRDAARRAVALVSVSVMGDARFRGQEWLKAQAIPVIWVAAQARGHDPRFYPPAYAHTLPLAFTGAELRTLVFRLAGLQSRLAAPRRRGAPPPLVAESTAMRELLVDVDLYADCGANVLVHGETGVGKERIAERLHAQSVRAGGPFVAVNCGAVPDGLFEAQFFGHAKGAFTGAVGAHKGYFEQADGGTLFLDEIGDLPLQQQVKLLRVLERGDVTRLGSTQPVEVDFRLVSATNRDLRALVRQGSFRADLYYRLAVVELSVPSLAERGPAECAALFKVLVARHLPTQAPAPPAWLLEEIGTMAFPGNVRELANLAERIAIVVRRHGHWEEGDLRSLLFRVRALAAQADAAAARGGPLGPPLDDMEGETGQEAASGQERERIIATLNQHGWRRQETAAALGISRKVLWEKMRKHGITGGGEAVDE